MAERFMGKAGCECQACQIARLKVELEEANEKVVTLKRVGTGAYHVLQALKYAEYEQVKPVVDEVLEALELTLKG